ncbi:nuclear poly(A) polymerase 3 [Dendrobium catenatum]|uniref:nuclear poly(A) polymerase 3 n=1 Tax=Dendrobium catenatum TaxID=906689 RepID=UPI0009F51843|nr:nuclear poly(A) polymerase 3 [Dendrobium catenatum]
MAFGYPIDGRVVDPGLHLVVPRTLVVSSPPLPPLFSLPPVGYVVTAPVAGFQNLSFPRLFFPRSFIAPRVALDPAILIQMEGKRVQSLLQFMASEGLVPSLEEETKRKKVMEELKQIVLSWIRKVAWQRRLPKDIIARTSATILAYGSYGLGVHGSDSDIDALCIGPYFASMEEDFFTVLHGMLQSRSEVSELHCVKTAKVPLMRFKFNGISIDFPYAQLRVVSVPADVNIFDPCLVIPDETSQRSFSGVRVNQRILQLVPNLKHFQAMLRCMKLWALRRGLYSNLLGFFGGIHLAILAAFVCQRYPNASISALITLFFETFSNWPWPKPVFLQDQSIPSKNPDERYFMPILMPCSPFDWCNSNITRGTFRKIMKEIKRGYDITKDQGRLDFQWSHLFNHFPFTESYNYFVRICLIAPDHDELQDWAGWVKSRLPGLLLKLEREHGFCDPNPKEYVDSNVDNPNVVFYWGLSSLGRAGFDLSSIKEEFMKSINKEEHSGYQNTKCKLELSILQTSQLPKDLDLNYGSEKRTKACWRIMDYYNQHRKPAYSQYIPSYFIGYVASSGDQLSPIG